MPAQSLRYRSGMARLQVVLIRSLPSRLVCARYVIWACLAAVLGGITMPLAMLGVNDVGTSYALFVTSRAVGSGFTVLGSFWWAVLFVERLVLWRPKATYLALFGEPQRWQVLLAVLVGVVAASALIVNSTAVSVIGSPVPTQQCLTALWNRATVECVSPSVYVETLQALTLRSCAQMTMFASAVWLSTSTFLSCRSSGYSSDDGHRLPSGVFGPC